MQAWVILAQRVTTSIDQQCDCWCLPIAKAADDHFLKTRRERVYTDGNGWKSPRNGVGAALRSASMPMAARSVKWKVEDASAGITAAVRDNVFAIESRYRDTTSGDPQFWRGRRHRRAIKVDTIITQLLILKYSSIATRPCGGGALCNLSVYAARSINVC